ncbi:hypothetical protein B0T19DRAFT_50901 [Cercophora scortea]|uniref:Uncharacterized protein n=1 Tax=Cercophora scortea TaxID=314031 RepID=A0AAE0J4F9_9PEZI|nr:hypothetical protein B0T19DRAFT_50901 [Cercophora scortea]
MVCLDSVQRRMGCGLWLGSKSLFLFFFSFSFSSFFSWMNSDGLEPRRLSRVRGMEAARLGLGLDTDRQTYKIVTPVDTAVQSRLQNKTYIYIYIYTTRHSCIGTDKRGRVS